MGNKRGGLVEKSDRPPTNLCAHGKPVNCDAHPELQFLRDNPDEKEGTHFRASFVVGVGFHIYF
jgi:hypothetical protein